MTRIPETLTANPFAVLAERDYLAADTLAEAFVAAMDVAGTGMIVQAILKFNMQMTDQRSLSHCRMLLCSIEQMACSQDDAPPDLSDLDDVDVARIASHALHHLGRHPIHSLPQPYWTGLRG